MKKLSNNEAELKKKLIKKCLYVALTRTTLTYFKTHYVMKPISGR